MRRLEGSCRQGKSVFIAKTGSISALYSGGEFPRLCTIPGARRPDDKSSFLLLTVGSEHSPFRSRTNGCPMTL